MTFSVIVSNYNYGRFLAEAIESALSQNWGGVTEVIVVDDGSADDSRRIVERYGDRIRPILKSNGGQGSALNAGFAVSSGDIILFLDADDVLSPEAIKILAFSWRNGLAKIVYPLEVIDADGKSQGRRIGGVLVPDATRGPFGVDSPTSGNAFSRTVLGQIMPIPAREWRICADAFLTAASSLFGETLLLDRPLAKYRVHGKNNVAGIDNDVARIRRATVDNLNLYASLRRLAPDRIGSCDEWLGAYPQHWVGRMTSLRESPADHPWPDRIAGLMRKAIWATWRQPYWNVRKKLAYSVWLLAYGVAPKRIARALKEMEGRGASGLPQLVLGR